MLILYVRAKYLANTFKSVVFFNLLYKSHPWAPTSHIYSSLSAANASYLIPAVGCIGDYWGSPWHSIHLFGALLRSCDNAKAIAIHGLPFFLQTAETSLRPAELCHLASAPGVPKATPKLIARI